MEATLPLSGAVSTAKPRVKPLPAAAPSISLPLRFVLAGLGALFTGVVWLAASPALLTTYHYNQNIIALTHLFVLGWLGSVVMGAMYQLVPVALETRLYSERLARWHFVFHVVGFVGMVWMFKTWNLKNVGHFGSVLAIGALLFVYNLVRTLLRVQKWNVVAAGIACALAWFSCAILAGLSIVAGKCSYASGSLAPAGLAGFLVREVRALGVYVSHFDAIGAMHAHAHLGVVGLFTMLTMAVSFKLVPMFTLSEVQNRRRAAASLVLLNAGLIGTFFSILLRSSWKFSFACVICAALALYGWEMIAIVRARRRAALDWGVRTFLSALTLLVPLAGLGLVLAWPRLPLNVFTGQLENLYGFLGLVGFLTFAILGMLHKIIPFLVWYHSYSPHVGKARLPMLADLYSERLQVAGYWFWWAGLLMAGTGILIQSNWLARCGVLGLAATLGLLGLNVAQMLSHVLRPKLQPLTPAPAR